MLVGVNRDPQFGPLVVFGLGGIYVEVLKDVTFRLAITRAEAAEQVRSIRTYALLQGVRGEAPADIAAAEEIILRVSQLVTEFPEIVEMDINPLVLHNQGEGAIVLDARLFYKAKAMRFQVRIVNRGAFSICILQSQSEEKQYGNPLCRLDRDLRWQKRYLCRPAGSGAARWLPRRAI